jgi:hypothetical protein
MLHLAFNYTPTIYSILLKDWDAGEERQRTPAVCPPAPVALQHFNQKLILADNAMVRPALEPLIWPYVGLV